MHNFLSLNINNIPVLIIIERVKVLNKFLNGNKFLQSFPDFSPKFQYCFWKNNLLQMG